MSTIAANHSTHNDVTEMRALELLGMGIIPSQVAAALGVEVSRLSQLLSDENFAAQVAERRFENLRHHTERDNRYDKLEDDLLTRLEDCLPMMHRPMEVLKAIQVINAAKRRGASAPESITNQNQIINLTIPDALIEKFQVNINNQVIKAGDQELLTIQSGTLLDMSKIRAEKGKPNERVINAEVISS